MPRELSKCREWEKDRRDRLKNEFTVLSKLLPCYEPSLSLSKIDILQKASAYIEELRVQIKELLATKSSNKTECEEINKLHERIKKLLTRNEQLGSLLKDAGIKVPSECGTIKKFKDVRPWSHKITAEQARILAKRESQKENEPKRKVIKKTTLKGKRDRNKVLPVNQRKIIKKSDLKVKKRIASKVINNTFRSNVPHTNLITLSTTQSCFIITNAPSNSVNQTVATNNTTVVTNSRVFSTPLVASAVKPAPSIVLTKTNSPINKLTSGTLLVANGNLLPVLPQQTLLPTPTLITNPTSLVVNSASPNNTTLIVVPKTSVKELNAVSSGNTLPNSNCTVSSKAACITKTLPTLKPKIDLTKTTQVNKVPIPALTSRYANSFLLLSASSDTNNKQNKSKVGQRKCSEKNKNNRENKPKSKKDNIQNDIKTVASENIVTSTVKSNDQDTTAGINSICVVNKEPDTKSLIIENKKSEILEPKLKKQKCEDTNINNIDCAQQKDQDISKKVSVTSTYSIDSLCSESVTTNITDSTQKNDGREAKRSIITEVNDSQNISIETNKRKESCKDNKEINENVENSESLHMVEAVNMESKEHNFNTNEQNSNKSKNTLATQNLLSDANQTNCAKEELKGIDLPQTLGHSQLSNDTNDIFASLSHVTSGGQNPESTSPTAAFLLAFPLVSSLNSLKVTEVIEDETSDSQHGTPTLLQIGTMDTTKTTQSQSDNLTSNLLNLDNFSFFSSKDICNSFYPSFDVINTSTVSAVNSTTTTTNVTKTIVCESEKKEYTELSSTVVKPKNMKPLFKEVVSTNSQPIIHTKCISTSSPYNVNESKSLNTQVSSNVTVSTQKNKPIVSDSQKLKHTINTTVPSCNDYTNSSIYNQTFYTNVEVAATTTCARANNDQTQILTTKQNENRIPCTYYNTSTTYSLPQYNTFNPFTDLPKSGSSYTNPTRSYNDALYTNNANNYSYNYHTENCNTNPTTTKNPKNDRSFYTLNYDTSYDYNRMNESQKYDSRNQQFNNYFNQNQMQPREKTTSSSQLKSNSLNPNNSVRPPVNWMTAPDLKQQIQTDMIVPPFGKEMEFSSNAIYPTNSFVSGVQTTYFNANSTLYSATDLHNNFNETRKIDTSFTPIGSNTFQRNDLDENQFSWSPSKLPQLLDPSHNFVSSTLPTLVGDLALGNTQPTITFMDQKLENKNSKENYRSKENSRRSKTLTNYDNQTNFLSVSQLVDHNKPDVIPSRVANRRSSGNRTSKNIVQAKANKRVQKPIENKEATGITNYNGIKLTHHTDKNNIKLNDFSNQRNMENNSAWITKNRQINKNPPSSYSAEALIGHQPQAETIMAKHRNQQNYTGLNKSLQVPFLTDNIISYFPPVDIPPDNTYVQQNQNYHSGSFSHNFSSSIQNNVYSCSTFMPNTSTITTSYLSSTNFIPEVGNHEYTPMIPETFSHVGNRISEKQVHKNSNKQNNNERIDDKGNMAQATIPCNMSSSNVHHKKAKRKPPNETNLPGFVDFNFLSIPGAINSPILPDDFHTHSNFLPPPTPTQLYSCKNTLYSKQPSDLVPNNLLPIPPVSRTGIQHPEISPSLNNVVGNTLTNFNLSTIFPEINKVPGSDIYPDVNKSKDFGQRDFLTSTVQPSFPTKSNLSMGYINSASTT